MQGYATSGCTKHSWPTSFLRSEPKTCRKALLVGWGFLRYTTVVAPPPGGEGRKTLLGDKAEVRDKISRDILALALISCYYWNRMTLFIQYWLNVVSGTKQQSELAVKFVYDAELRCVLWRVQSSMRNRSYHVNVQWHHFINIFRQYRVHWNSNFCTWCFPGERTRKML